MRQFVTKAEKKKTGIEGAEPITFQVDDREITAHPPNEGQMLLFMANSGAPSQSVRAHGLMSFLDAIFTGADNAYLARRLESDDDPFGVSDLNDIVHWLLEEWSNPPTVGEPDSSPPTPSAEPSASRPRSGKKSTAKRPSGG